MAGGFSRSQHRGTHRVLSLRVYHLGSGSSTFCCQSVAKKCASVSPLSSSLAFPAEGNVEYWDTLLPAFGLRVSARGRKTWIVAARRPGSQHPARLRIGLYPPMQLADARDKAREMITSGAP
jgi:Arm DNA-binding domain